MKLRRVHASKPTFAGTRIPVSAVETFLQEGASSDEDILAAYWQLTAADIAVVRGHATAG